MKKHARKSEKIVKYTKKQVAQLKDQTDYKKLDRMKDSDIDYSDIPETNEVFWSEAMIEDPGVKQAISLRVDKDVLSWFKQKGGRYQKVMNQVLRQYMNAHKHSR